VTHDPQRAIIERIVAFERANRLAHYFARGAAPWQREVFEDSSPKRFIGKANKVGGSYGPIAEEIALALGCHPTFDLPTPNVGIIYVPDLDHSYADDVCRTIRMLEPAGYLHKSCSYTESSGYKVGGRRGIKWANDSRHIFRSSHQSAKSQAGIFGDHGLINEAPARHLWGEIMRAFSLSATAPIIMNFTAVDDDRKSTPEADWIWPILDAPNSPWSQYAIPLRPSYVPHRVPKGCPGDAHCTIDGGDCEIDPCNVRQQWALCPIEERAQRIDAARDAPSFDRFISGFTDACIVTDDDFQRIGVPAQVQIGITFDHGEAPGHETEALYAWWKDAGGDNVVLVLDEYGSRGRTTSATDASCIEDQLQSHGLGLFEVDRAHGDINTAGKSAVTTSVNRELEIAFASLVRGDPNNPPFRIHKAKKGSGSVLAGARVLSSACAAGRLWFHERCKRHINAMRKWKGTDRGEDSKIKHWVDDVRYGPGPLLDTTKQIPAQSVRVV
jgi:hypothetical protein